MYVTYQYFSKEIRFDKIFIWNNSETYYDHLKIEVTVVIKMLLFPPRFIQDIFKFHNKGVTSAKFLISMVNMKLIKSLLFD